MSDDLVSPSVVEDEPGPAPSPEPEPKKRKGLLSALPRREPKNVDGGKPAKKAREPQPVKAVRTDISEGLGMIYQWAAGRVGEADPGVGNAMKLTAPTAGRLGAKGLRKFPLVYNLLAVFLGAGTAAIDTTSVVMLPITMQQMERDPNRIPELLPRARTLMRPILRDMLKAAQEQRKIEEELAQLQADLGQAQGGVPFSLDHMILVDMLGMPRGAADRIIAHEDMATILRDYVGPAPEPEPAVA